MIWEYKVVRIDHLPLIGNGHLIEEILNREGALGWEAWSVWENKPFTINLLIFSTTKLHKEQVFYFKRQKVV